jgi:methionyl-tRNA formyltransferase
MEPELDHGPIIAKLKIKNQKLKITYTELSKELADLGAELLIKTLPKWIDGKITPQEQDHSQATFCKIIKKEDGRINWNKSAESIERQIRAFQKWPESYTDFNGKILKITEANFANPSTMLGASKKIGEVFLTDTKKLAVQTENGILILNTIQLEGKKPMPVKIF